MKAPLLAALSLALAASAQELPPGHPPLDGPIERAPPLPAAEPEASGGLPQGHPPVSGTGQAPTVEELIQKLDANPELKKGDKTFEVAGALGKLYYSHGRWADAIELYGQALAKTEPARKLYLAQRKKAAGAGQEVSCQASGEGVDSLTLLAQQRAREGDASAAVACAKLALRRTEEVATAFAHAKFNSGDLAGALAAHERQLDLDPASPEALFGSATILLDSKGDDLAALRQARAAYQRYLRDHPAALRAEQARSLLARTEEAIAAGGVSRLATSRRRR